MAKTEKEHGNAVTVVVVIISVCLSLSHCQESYASNTSAQEYFIITPDSKFKKFVQNLRTIPALVKNQSLKFSN